MKRYSKNSQIKKLKVVRSAKNEYFYAEIIRNPSNSISIDCLEKAIREISSLVEKAWGKFPKKYLESSIFHAHYLLILRDKSEKIIGVAPIKKLEIDGRHVYSFGLTAVDPDFQGLGFMKKMHAILGRRIFVENVLGLRPRLELVFITPNIRTVGSLAKVADFIYPNPYLVDDATGRVEDADEKTWETVKHYLLESGEDYRKLDINGCVMVGFYDDKPNLVVRRKSDIPDKKLMMFAKTYLKPGNEVVVRAIVSIGGLIRGNF